MKKFIPFVLLLTVFQNTKAQNIYGQLEDWRNVPVATTPSIGLESPYKWYGIDSLEQLATFFYPQAVIKKQCYKTSDAHGGSYAAQLVTINQDSLGIVPGLLSNAQFGFDQSNFDPNDPIASITYYGGTPIAQRINNVTAWVKYTPRGADAANISVRAVLEEAGQNNTDSIVGTGELTIPQLQTTYTQVSVPINYINTTVVPDKIYILIASSTFNSVAYTPTDSSMLWVDDINLVGTNGIEQLSFSQVVNIFPNPSTGVVHMNSSSTESVSIIFYNISGQAVATKTIKANGTTDLSFLPCGTYIYDVKDEKGKLKQHGKLSLTK